MKLQLIIKAIKQFFCKTNVSKRKKKLRLNKHFTTILTLNLVMAYYKRMIWIEEKKNYETQVNGYKIQEEIKGFK